MKKTYVTTMILLLISAFLSAELQTIKLSQPDKKRGLPFMETLSVKASGVEWSEQEIGLQDLSDLLWAANGINRPEQQKSTASSALNAREVAVYVFMKNGAFLYSPEKHELQPVLEGDFRSQLMMTRPPRPDGRPPRPPESNPPLQLILVADSSRFPMGSQEMRYEWCAIDTGIVSQNISLFCAATGLKTRPRAAIDKNRIKNLLGLKDSHYVLLNHPIGHGK